MINKILIANRGEIAVRITRTINKLQKEAVAVYADNDANAWHVEMADEAYPLGNGNLKDTYLNIDKIIRIALACGADAIHPGYGFLSENPLFAEACEKNGLVFIGPNAQSIRLMGNKIAAREAAENFGLPVSKGVTGDVPSLLQQAGNLKYPVLVKAAAGGGGKGMRIVNSNEELAGILETTSREALNYFGNSDVYIEQFIENPRHIEIQILADQHGQVVHLFERECSIQRRYQKIIEESPSPTLDAVTRTKMGEAAAQLCKGIGYQSAGTIEFLVDPKLNFYFLEMNTRIQVEHPVTEMVTGFDLVEEQIFIAEGHPLRIKQEHVKQQGHAIECRIYAEDPSNNFMPSPGHIRYYHEPAGQHLRIDSSLYRAMEVQSHYDPMISKLVAWGINREQAIASAALAVKNYAIHGIHTNLGYLYEVLHHKAYITNNISTHFCEKHSNELLSAIAAKTTPSDEVIAAFLLHNLFCCPRATEVKSVWHHIGYWRQFMQFEVLVNEQKVAINLQKIALNEIYFEVDGRKVTARLLELKEGIMRFVCNEHLLRVFVSLSDEALTVVQQEIQQHKLCRLDQLDETKDHGLSLDGEAQGSLFSPMPGKVIKVNVSEGMEVNRGMVLVVVEAMKMENNVVAGFKAIVDQVNVKEGEMVDTKTQLIHLKEYTEK